MTDQETLDHIKERFLLLDKIRSYTDAYSHGMLQAERMAMLIQGLFKKDEEQRKGDDKNGISLS